jgi:alpha-ribazole phosphatase
MADESTRSRSIVLLRHTPLTGADGLCYGRSDITLPDTAPQDMANVVVALPAFDRIISSPSQRCRELALAAQRAQRSPAVVPTFDARWLEIDFGRWEGLGWDAVPRAELDAWAADTWNYAPGGGESARELYARVAESLQDLHTATQGTRTLVVTHAGPLRAATVLIQRLSFAEHFNIRAEPGAWVELSL